MADTPTCPLCRPNGEELLWRDEVLRVIRVGDPDYPGFCRVILNRHVKEMTDLPPDERQRFMQAVYAVESALRELLAPDKINLASLGNQVPHLHWHVIPRFSDDPHFPDPIWAARRRAAPPRTVSPAILAERLRERLATAG